MSEWEDDDLCGIDEEKGCLSIAIAITHFNNDDEKTIKLVDSYTLSSNLDLSGIGVESSEKDATRLLSFSDDIDGDGLSALINTKILTLTDISLSFGSTIGPTVGFLFWFISHSHKL
jgi:hypothetical protein